MTLLNFSWRRCIQTGKKITNKTKHSTKLNWNDTPLFNFSTDDDRKALPTHLPSQFKPLFTFSDGISAVYGFLLRNGSVNFLFIIYSASLR